MIGTGSTQRGKAAMHALSSLVSRTLLCAVFVTGCAAPATAPPPSKLERGRYLVTSVMACGNCHTPKDADGRPIAGKELSGGGVGFDIPPYRGVTANITPDPEHLGWYEVFGALRFAIVSVRTSTRSMAYGQMERPEDPDDLIMFRTLLDGMIA